MEIISSLIRLTRVETYKLWQKSTAKVVLILLFVSPIVGEILLLELSVRDAIFPRVTHFIFSGDILMFISLATVVVSVLALGNDYELGTVTTILSSGVTRWQFIFSKIASTVAAALVNGLAYIAGGLISTLIVHLTQSDVPFFTAAGEDIIWRLLGEVMVVCMVGFISSGIVMLALVLWRSAWAGMLAGIGYFFMDFFFGGLGLLNFRGLENLHRFSFSYYALSMLERYFPPDPFISLPRSWSENPAGIWEAPITLIIIGSALTCAAILIFQQQDVRIQR
jgi:ABC-type transport system involved in multi-copper enzyme maturation permease subunit